MTKGERLAGSCEDLRVPILPRVCSSCHQWSRRAFTFHQNSPQQGPREKVGRPIIFKCIFKCSFCIIILKQHFFSSLVLSREELLQFGAVESFTEALDCGLMTEVSVSRSPWSFRRQPATCGESKCSHKLKLSTAKSTSRAD